MRRISRQTTALSAILIAALGVSACGIVAKPTVRNHGHVQLETRIEAIQPGQTTKANVVGSMGSPSTVSSFGPETWYYISSRTEQMTWQHPETTQRQVVAVTFDEGGVVEQVNRYGLEDGQEVAIVGRETETRGRTLTFFEQMFGNLGRLPGGTSGVEGDL